MAHRFKLGDKVRLKSGVTVDDLEDYNTSVEYLSKTSLRVSALSELGNYILKDGVTGFEGNYIEARHLTSAIDNEGF